MTEDYAAMEDEHGPWTYQKFPLTIIRGSGASLWDERGLEYIDFMGGYGVAIVGHCNPAVVAAVKEQAGLLITCHGSLYNDRRALFLERLTGSSPKGLDAAYLSNSGAEAVEVAIKLARKSTGKKGIISMKGGYHGKTFGALSATWNRKYKEPFEPLLSGFKHAEYGNVESFEKEIDSNTAGVIVEPIQGESGIIVPPDGYLRAVRELCDKHGIAMVADEIQTGLGRTGRMWAVDHEGVVPDIMTVAKGLGGGIPIGATVTKKETLRSLKRGEQTSTFGGNPLACAAGIATLEYIKQHDLPAQAASKGLKLKDGLKRITESHKIVREPRGIGLMLALELRVDIQNLLSNALKEHVLFTYSGRNVVRMLPPIIMTDGQIEKGLSALEKVVSQEQVSRTGQD